MICSRWYARLRRAGMMLERPIAAEAVHRGRTRSRRNPRQADVLPTKRRDVGQEIVGDCSAVVAQLPDSLVEIDCVPVHDGGDNEAQAQSAFE